MRIGYIYTRMYTRTHVCDRLQYTVTHCHTLQNTAIHCNTLQHTATHSIAKHSKVCEKVICVHACARARIFNTLKHTKTHCNIFRIDSYMNHVSTMQYTAIRCNTLQYTAIHCNTMQYTATHCNTRQHAAAYCNTLMRHVGQRVISRVAVCAVRCSVLRCVAMCCCTFRVARCSVLLCVAVCCSMLPCISSHAYERDNIPHHCVAVCCSALQCVAICCRVFLVVRMNTSTCLVTVSSSVLQLVIMRSYGKYERVNMPPQCIAVCCSVLLCVAVYCSVFHVVRMNESARPRQCIAVRCRALQYCAVISCHSDGRVHMSYQCVAVCCSALQCFAMFCRVFNIVRMSESTCLIRVLQCIAVCCTALQNIATYFMSCVSASQHASSSLLQRVAACCSVLQCATVYFMTCVSVSQHASTAGCNDVARL